MNTNQLQDPQKVNVMIGIVGNWIENTERIKDCEDAGKKLLLFFDTVHDASKSMRIKVQEVDVFKEPMEPRCACLYDDVD